MAEIYFSSDHHFHHENIIRYAERPFASVEEMNEELVERHNAVVKPQDHWYCLGDVTMERDNQGRGLEILKRMNGHKRLIMGNHDHYAVKHYLKYFEKVMAHQMLSGLRLTHFPVHPSSIGGAVANVHGHIHQHNAYPPLIIPYAEKDPIRPYINICVEKINYTPVSFGQLQQMVVEAVKRHA